MLPLGSLTDEEINPSVAPSQIYELNTYCVQSTAMCISENKRVPTPKCLTEAGESLDLKHPMAAC